jgi:hypothetical protein
VCKSSRADALVPGRRLLCVLVSWADGVEENENVQSFSITCCRISKSGTGLQKRAVQRILERRRGVVEGIVHGDIGVDLLCFYGMFAGADVRRFVMVVCRRSSCRPESHIAHKS